ncbi:MAG: tRNA pseudouridine(38-40) synthase TruA [Ignavibacteriaceae bacterium]
MTFKLYIEYEGTRYSGWQIQPKIRTIQGMLMETATNIFNSEKIPIMGAGRTDAGVHALEQIAHFQTDTKIRPEIIRMKFNDLLPHDINILRIDKIENKFHSRHDALNRSYIYCISKRRTAFGKNFVWWIKDSLDTQRMLSASNIFIGLHDFISFADKNSDEPSTKVQIENIEFFENESFILIRIIGSHFLHKMVRRMIGLLVEIGRGNLSPKDIEIFLKHYSVVPAKFTSPPSGLYLEKIVYSPRDKRKQLHELIPALPFTN